MVLFPETSTEAKPKFNFCSKAEFWAIGGRSWSFELTRFMQKISRENEKHDWSVYACLLNACNTDNWLDFFKVKFLRTHCKFWFFSRGFREKNYSTLETKFDLIQAQWYEHGNQDTVESNTVTPIAPNKSMVNATGCPITFTAHYHFVKNRGDSW